MSPDSPLAEASPDSLSVIFSTDPLVLTDSQLHTAIIELRRRRNAFLSEEAAKQAKGKVARVKPLPQTSAASSNSDKPPAELSLDDLD